MGLALSSSLTYGMFNPLLRERLERAGATPGEQAQAVGILQSYVQTGSTDKFDAQMVHDVIAGGTSAYLASYRVTMLIMAALIAFIAAVCFWLLQRRVAKP